MEHSKDKWQGNSSLQECVRRMYQHHLHTADVTFQVGKDGDEVKAHRFVLMCRSSVFFSMFAEHDPPKEALRLVDIKKDVFIQFVEFLYTDFTSVTAENFGDLMYCAKKYEIGFLSTLCKRSLKSFNSTEIVCQMMEFAQVYDDPEIVKICLETVENQMPYFLYTNLFLKLCSTCVYKITQYDRLLIPERVIFEQVLRWSEEECTQQNLPVTAENQRKVLGDILYEIRFPIMDHQYLEDVVCGSDVLNDGEKVEVLRQQLKSKKEKSAGRFKLHKRKWQPTAVMISESNPTRKKMNIAQTGQGYSLQFRVSSQAALLGISLNIENYTEVEAQGYSVITSITPLELIGGGKMDNVKELSTPLCDVKKNLVELYPRFFILLTKGVIYTVSVRLDKPYRYSSMRRGLSGFGSPRVGTICKEREELPTPVAFNGKSLSVFSSSTNDRLIRGLWMT